MIWFNWYSIEVNISFILLCCISIHSITLLLNYSWNICLETNYSFSIITFYITILLWQWQTYRIFISMISHYHFNTMLELKTSIIDNNPYNIICSINYQIFTRSARIGETSIHSFIFIQILVIDLDRTRLNEVGRSTICRFGISIHHSIIQYQTRKSYKTRISETISIRSDGC